MFVSWWISELCSSINWIRRTWLHFIKSMVMTIRVLVFASPSIALMIRQLNSRRVCSSVTWQLSAQTCKSSWNRLCKGLRTSEYNPYSLVRLICLRSTKMLFSRQTSLSKRVLLWSRLNRMLSLICRRKLTKPRSKPQLSSMRPRPNTIPRLSQIKLRWNHSYKLLLLSHSHMERWRRLSKWRQMKSSWNIWEWLNRSNL
jgi:hypothetical protein